ncbi:hypothetical protein [Bacillus gaemokensis]|uniref:Uncharacterized protein n=1 Tax=Bacillus gaemokensis TaxID=574375 RepID=A0A073K2P7_9BACI|nr:hypothetical protein [Bacillus gaemokensis]KEK21584.1 hypothetical protein BAGA_28660 [Bacillus gaemokensis]KYG30733.1 hypothetical protein AZF08_27595 [Bacillus gaemokensis]
MNNQTKHTNTENSEQNFPDDIGPCEQEEATTCIGDIRYKCKNGRWKPTYEYCPDDNTPT